MNTLRIIFGWQQSPVNLFRLYVRTAVFALALPSLLQATPPDWWSDRGVTDSAQNPNDYAVANQGQLKFIAEKAAAEFNAHLPGGTNVSAGADLLVLLNKLASPSSTTNDYAAVNLGQLKAVAKPFYDLLKSVGYTNAYPWDNSPTLPNDYALANIGQVKNMFSFDLMALTTANDSNGDGLPDWWEEYYFKTLNINTSALAPSGDGLTILQCFQQGINPIDPYNGQTPTLTIVSGNNQTASPNGFVFQALTVTVADNNGNALPNVPVTFTTGQGGGQVQTSCSSTPSTSATVITNYFGRASVYFRLPNATSSATTIIASAGTGSNVAQRTFSEKSDDGSGAFSSPFGPSDVVVTLNSDGSADLSWVNNIDSTADIPISLKQKDGTWKLMTTVPAGTTTVHIPAPGT